MSLSGLFLTFCLYLFVVSGGDTFPFLHGKFQVSGSTWSQESWVLLNWPTPLPVGEDRLQPSCGCFLEDHHLWPSDGETEATEGKKFTLARLWGHAVTYTHDHQNPAPWTGLAGFVHLYMPSPLHFFSVTFDLYKELIYSLKIPVFFAENNLK